MNRTELTDGQLVGRMINGDGESARLLIERYRRPLFALLRRSLIAAEAEDAFQNIWLRVVRAAGSYDPLLPFDRWLFSIAWNVVRDEWARGGRHKHEGLSAELVNSDPDAESLVVTGDRNDRIVAAVRALPERMAEVILLRYFDELTEAECAGRLGVPLGTIKSRTHTGLKRLREILDGGSR